MSISSRVTTFSNSIWLWSNRRRSRPICPFNDLLSFFLSSKTFVFSKYCLSTSRKTSSEFQIFAGQWVDFPRILKQILNSMPLVWFWICTVKISKLLILNCFFLLLELPTSKLIGSVSNFKIGFGWILWTHFPSGRINHSSLVFKFTLPRILSWRWKVWAESLI